MSWVDVEDAVHRVVVRAGGLDADKVTWSYQNVNETENSHVVLNFGGMRAIGIDMIKQQDDTTRPNGQEVGQQVVGIREVELGIDCITDATHGESSARFLAERIRTNLRLETNILDLRRVQLSVFDTSAQIVWVPDIKPVRFRGRASLSVRCYAPTPTVIEYVGYISRIRGTFYPDGWLGHSGASGVNFDSDNAP
jgi:hypothetical protein